MPRRVAGAVVVAAAALWATGAQAGVAPYTIEGDAIPAPLAGLAGDPARGRAIVADRRTGLCLLCHQGPFPEVASPGNLATDLRGAGSRWTTGQLRLRVVDARRLDPSSLMPAFHRTDGLQRVGTAWQGRPVLSAQQIEDVVAFLATLK